MVVEGAIYILKEKGEEPFGVRFDLKRNTVTVSVWGRKGVPITFPLHRKCIGVEAAEYFVACYRNTSRWRG